MVAAAAFGISSCSSGGNVAGNAGAMHQVECYARVTDTGSAPFTVQVLGASDCTNIANDLDGMSLSIHATPNTGAATGTEICSGLVGNYPVNIYGEAGDTGACFWLGLQAVP